MEKTKLAASMASVAARVLAGTSLEMRNAALLEIAKALEESAEEIFAANNADIELGIAENLPQPLQKRLVFDSKKLADAVNGIKSLVNLPDPIGKTTLARELDEGLNLFRVTCPIGVIGVIFESRPDALVQIASLCLKSGNAVLLKGGSEATSTNRVLADIIYKASRRIDNSIPKGWMELLETRDDVYQMLRLDDCIDLIIPRGSNAFVKFIMENTKIPVLGHADGVCHIYADKFLDFDMAVNIIRDAKTQYVSVCNAVETLLVHADIAPKLLPLVKEALNEYAVELFGCEKTREIIEAQPARDWHTEYLDYKLSVKVVENIGEALTHIGQYGSKHTEAIITSDTDEASHFMRFVDAGNVFWNCSTRFSDGFVYGFGAEVGISTSKIHARGPVGLEGLTSYKYLLFGNGQIIQDYAMHKKAYTHRDIPEKCPICHS